MDDMGQASADFFGGVLAGVDFDARTALLAIKLLCERYRGEQNRGG